jgi:alkaline phosphatase D
MKFPILIFLAVFIQVTLLSCKPQPKKTPYLVIFSFDGFRWDYADSCNTPVLDSIAKNGVKADAMISSFPTVTFPNHYAIATGLYPGNNGLVHNTFFDKKLNRKYSIGNRSAVEDSVFYKGFPLWNLLLNNNIRTATCFWVGSEAPINGKYANYWMKYNSSIAFADRMDTVIGWLKKPESMRPNLIMSYFSEPDHSGHDFGPYSAETRSKVEMLDSLLGYFISELKKLAIGNEVNIIVLSDHGMAAIDSSKNIIMDTFINERWIKRVNGSSPCIYLEPHDVYYDSVVTSLQKVEHIKFYKREFLPESWHLTDTNRIDKLVILADNGYMLRWSNQKAQHGGAHGYNNNDSDMNAIFYATGPVFKENYRQKTFENVDIYPLVNHIFSIENMPVTDGKYDRVKGMLK